MINDSMSSNRIIGMIQPKEQNKQNPSLHKIGCAGKITSFNETDDGRYLIILNGICRFKITDEVNSDYLYRECKVEYEDFSSDLTEKSNDIKFLEPVNLIIKQLSLEEKQVLLESKDLNMRKEKLEEILNTYILDNFNKKTLQ